MMKIHVWILSYIQRLVDWAARQGFDLFRVVNIVLSIHVVISAFAIPTQSVLAKVSWVLIFSFSYVVWRMNVPWIKPGYVNPRKLVRGWSILSLWYLSLGMLPPLSIVSLQYISLSLFFFVSQCDYIEPQLRQKKRKEAFA